MPEGASTCFPVSQKSTSSKVGSAPLTESPLTRNTFLEPVLLLPVAVEERRSVPGISALSTI